MVAPTNGQVLTWDTTISPPGPDWQTSGGGGGDISFNGIQVFVSQYIGNDSNTGSPTNPLATFGAAITLAEVQVNPAIIIGMDQATYDENLTISSNTVSIYAPSAFLQPTSGDAITFTGAPNFNTYTFAQITANAGNAINLTSTDTSVMFLNVQQEMFGSVNAVLSAGASIVINCPAIEGNLTQNGGGDIFIVGIESAGSVTGNVFFNTALQNSFSYNVASLTVNGSPVVLQNPTADQEITGYALIIDNGILVGSSTYPGYIQMRDGVTGAISMQFVPGQNFSTNYIVAITNAEYNQNSVLTIPDPAVTAGSFAIVNSNTVTSGNLPVFQGTNGTLADSGVSLSSLTSFVPQTFINQTWQAGSTSAFVGNAPCIAPWSSNANISTGYYNEGYYFVLPNTPSNTFTLALDFGTQPAGVYALLWTVKQYDDGAILSVSETNTSLAIGTFDTFVPNTGGANLIAGDIEMYFNWAATGDMNIQWASSAQNPLSSGYNFALLGIVELIQIS